MPLSLNTKPDRPQSRRQTIQQSQRRMLPQRWEFLFHRSSIRTPRQGKGPRPRDTLLRCLSSFERWQSHTLIDDQLERLNGIALSPDQNTLYVANSHKPRAIWMSYQLNPDGTVRSKSLQDVPAKLNPQGHALMGLKSTPMALCLPRAQAGLGHGP